jgi:hypothetical protein
MLSNYRSRGRLNERCIRLGHPKNEHKLFTYVYQSNQLCDTITVQTTINESSGHQIVGI